MTRRAAALALLVVAVTGAACAVSWHQGLTWPQTTLLWAGVALLAGTTARHGSRRGP